jgi:hypothetical protein
MYTYFRGQKTSGGSKEKEKEWKARRKAHERERESYKDEEFFARFCSWAPWRGYKFSESRGGCSKQVR